MKVDVMSRSKFEKYMQDTHNMTSIVISISAYDEQPPVILNNPRNGILGVLTLQFNDTSNPEPTALGISWTQAMQIATFVRNSKELVDKIVVHCGAGQSRSAGVAAAILKYYTNDDTDIYDNTKYTPNNLCYRRVLEALMIG